MYYLKYFPMNAVKSKPATVPMRIVVRVLQQCLSMIMPAVLLPASSMERCAWHVAIPGCRACTDGTSTAQVALVPRGKGASVAPKNLTSQPWASPSRRKIKHFILKKMKGRIRSLQWDFISSF